MSYFENFLNANKAYVNLHGTAHLPLKPKTKVAIVTCMDHNFENDILMAAKNIGKRYRLLLPPQCLR